MDKEHKEQLQHFAERVDTIDSRLDRHLEIYAANGKESKRVADNLEKLLAQNNEMYSLFQTFKGGWTVSKWIFGFFVAVGSAIIIWQKLTKP